MPPFFHSAGAPLRSAARSGAPERRSADNAGALLAALPGQVAVVGADGSILAVNANWHAFARANGLAPERAARFNYLAVCAAAEGQDAQHAREAGAGIAAVLAGTRARFELVYPCHAPDEHRWFRMTAVPVQWDGNRAVLVMHANMTAEALAEQEARAAGEQLLKALAGLADQAELLDKAHDAIVVRNLDGTVRYWNEGASRLYGWSIREAVGTPLTELMRDQHPPVQELLPQLLQRGQLFLELQVRHKNGQVIWVNSSCTVLKDAAGRPDRILSVSTDITQRKLDAEELQRSRVLLETAQGVARLGSVELDARSGRLVRCSGIRELLVLDFCPTTLDHLMTWMAPGSRDALRAAVVEGSGSGPFELELEMLQQEGPRWLRARRAARPEGVDSPTCTIAFQDITAMRQAREEVLRLNRALERRVARRTRALESANRELEAFSYSVSHDLKAPLAAIDGFTQLLSERLKDRLDGREALYLERVRKGVAGMFALIDAMLGLHQLSRQAMQRQEVDLSEMARAIVLQLREQDPGRQAVVRIEPGIRAVCDPALMEIALRNLIGNAWKFSGGKPVTEIELRAEPAGPEGGITLVLQDRGAGFEPELAHELFAPFQRLHHASEFPGTGIGLATVLRIVERHGGTVRAEGRPGEGAVFWVCLPGHLGWPRSDGLTE